MTTLLFVTFIATVFLVCSVALDELMRTHVFKVLVGAPATPFVLAQACVQSRSHGGSPATLSNPGSPLVAQRLAVHPTVRCVPFAPAWLTGQLLHRARPSTSKSTNERRTRKVGGSRGGEGNTCNHGRCRRDPMTQNGLSSARFTSRPGGRQALEAHAGLPAA